MRHYLGQGGEEVAALQFAPLKGAAGHAFQGLRLRAGGGQDAAQAAGVKAYQVGGPLGGLEVELVVVVEAMGGQHRHLRPQVGHPLQRAQVGMQAEGMGRVVVMRRQAAAHCGGIVRFHGGMRADFGQHMVAGEHRPASGFRPKHGADFVGRMSRRVHIGQPALPFSIKDRMAHGQRPAGVQIPAARRGIRGREPVGPGRVPHRPLDGGSGL